jgi:hypothetical protein
MEDQPRVLFERLFGDGGTAAERRAEVESRRSILDSLIQEAAGLRKALGPGDQTKLSEYLESVRDIERRIQQAESAGQRELLDVPERPTGIPATFQEYSQLMFDLQVLAYQADLTRVSTMILAREGSSRAYAEIGVAEQGHNASHHRGDPVMMEKRTKILTYHSTLLSHFLEKLKATPDGDGSLLDHAIIVYGGGIGDGDLHYHTNLPLILAGKGSGQLLSGRHLQYPVEKETPMTNLLLTLMDKMGVPTPDKIGDSTEHLAGI